jgi:hypothetical protein
MSKGPAGCLKFEFISPVETGFDQKKPHTFTLSFSHGKHVHRHPVLADDSTWFDMAEGKSLDKLWNLSCCCVKIAAL